MNVAHWCLLLSLTFPLFAAVPPGEQLVPSDTLFFLTVPDFSKYKAAVSSASPARLWNDPSMHPFKEKFLARLAQEVIEPLERDLGIKFADYAALAQGQFTFAVVKPSSPAESFGWVFFLDVRDQQDRLKTNLATLQKRWASSGRQSRTEKIRDLEFTSLIIAKSDLSAVTDKLLPSLKSRRNAEEETKLKASKINILVGQSGSFLVAGNSAAILEKSLSRLTGGSAPALGDEPAYATVHAALFRDSSMFAWLNLKPILERLTQPAGGQPPPAGGMSAPQMLSAAGLSSIQSIAFSIRMAPDGAFAHLLMTAPESSRRGLLKVLATQLKDSAPPPFVPSDALKFSRTRVDLKKLWGGLENFMTDLNPATGGGLKLLFDSIGKDKDPNFDLRKDLIGNLGDDIISFSKSPRGRSLAEISSPPVMYLVSSPNPDQLAHALKVVFSFFGQQQGVEVKERELAGRKVFSFAQPAPGLDGTNSRTIHFMSGSGYVALSTDQLLLEEYVRNGGQKPAALRDRAPLAAAAQKVGGTGSGLFGFNNQLESTRVMWDAVKKDPALISKLFGALPIGDPLGADDAALKIKEWADFSLLPSFDQVSKYLTFDVYAGGADAKGFWFKSFTPAMEQIKPQ